jgi:hypothetical protein
MQRTHPFRPTLWHAAVPSYGPTYLFPLLFVVCEVHRLGDWLALNGADFAGYSDQSLEYALMLGLFAVQALAEVAFLAFAWAGRHEDIKYRLTNVTLGIFFSSFVLAFDYGLQVAF